MARGNQTIFYDVVNRGNQGLRVNFGAERSNNPTTLAHAGDGFMMRQATPGVERLAGRHSSRRRPIDGELSRGEKPRRQSDQAVDFHRVCFSEIELFDAAELRPWIGRHQTLSGRRRKHGESAPDRRAGPHAPREVDPQRSMVVWPLPRRQEKQRPAHADVCFSAGSRPTLFTN